MDRSARPRWARLLAVQESGLVAVILLMILTLWAVTPTIERPEIVRFGDSVFVDESPTAFVVNDASGFRRFEKRAGWMLEAREDGGHTLSRVKRVNKFLNKENLVGSVLGVAAFIAIMAVGMCGVIVMGGIDLSVGSMYALAGVVGALACCGAGGAQDGSTSAMSAWVSIPLALFACCTAGGAMGALNGAAIVGLRVHPFIITLGGMAVYRGLAFVMTEGQTIGDLPASLTSDGFKLSAMGVNPVPMFLMLGVALAGSVVMSRTVFGRRLYAIGDNETAARYAGVPVGRIKVIAYTISGALVGLSAAMYIGYFGSATSDAGNGYELKVIAAAVVGGCSLSGGRGTPLGAVLGAIVIQIIDNGIVMLSWSHYTNIVIGSVIILAVVVDQVKHRFASGR